MAKKGRRVMIGGKGNLGQVSGALARSSANSARKERALGKVGQILVARPKLAGQVSATTLSQVNTGADKSGQLAVTVRKALPEALGREATKTNTKRKKGYR